MSQPNASGPLAGEVLWCFGTSGSKTVLKATSGLLKSQNVLHYKFRTKITTTLAMEITAHPGIKSIANQLFNVFDMFSREIFSGEIRTYFLRMDSNSNFESFCLDVVSDFYSKIGKDHF